MSSYADVGALLERYSRETVAGCGCALAQGGETLYETYTGFADRENEKPFGPDTVCRLYSLTKLITVTAGMILFERGKFLFTDPLGEYLPGYASPNVAHTRMDGRVYVEKAKKPLLVKHAFAMQCGLPYPDETSLTGRSMLQVRKELKEKYGKYDLDTEIKAMAQVPLAFEPGDHFLYGFGHELVAGLIQAVTGKSVGQFMKEEIFEPLGMTSTGYRHFGDTKERMAVVYTKTPEGVLIPSPNQFDENHAPDALYEGGGAGLFSTVRDYLRFTQMLACGGVYKGEKILGRNTINLMRQNQLTAAQRQENFYGCYLDGYGYGLGVRTMIDPGFGTSNSPVGEFGWTGVLGTWASIYPEEQFSAVYMHQMNPNEEEYHHLRVRAAVYGTL